MEQRSLSCAFGDSLSEDLIECVSEFAEIGLDSMTEEGVFKEIPIVSTAISIYNIGNSIKERHNKKKLMIFIDEMNKGLVSSEKRIAYQQKFQSNEPFRNQEIEYLLVLIDRYVNYDKPPLLAKLYMAYLDKRISMEEMSMYAEIIDRLLWLDIRTLTANSNRYIVHRNIGGESILRLVALGLMTEITDKSPFEQHGNGNIGMTWESLTKSRSADRVYRRTEFGDKLAEILK